MTIEGWFDTRGRPLFEAELLLPGDMGVLQPLPPRPDNVERTP